MVKVRCPVCEKQFDSEESDAMPFCSQRCRDIDLNRWLSEDYGMPYESEHEPPQQNEDH